jgi:ABC-type antimicrobial peptide transport system permease subunit
VLALLSGLALVLSAVGVGGALTLIVRERARELAIRQALGAAAGRVWWEVQAGGLAVVGLGALVGVALTLVGARVFGSLVYGISVRDPISFVLAPLALCVAAFLAVGIPATRATRVSPIAALRDS